MKQLFFSKAVFQTSSVAKKKKKIFEGYFPKNLMKFFRTTTDFDERMLIRGVFRILSNI